MEAVQLKITETTPVVARTFSVTLTGKELNTIAVAYGLSAYTLLEDRARSRGVEVLDGSTSQALYDQLREFVTKEAL